MMENHTIPRRKALKLTGGAIGITLVGTTTATAQTSASVTFEDQKATGASVNIAETMLSDGGWIVLHETDGTTIGHSGNLDSGTHEDVNVAIKRGKVPKDSRKMDRTLIAMAHKDTGEEGEYEFPNGDPPYFKNGAPIVDTAWITF